MDDQVNIASWIISSKWDQLIKEMTNFLSNRESVRGVATTDFFFFLMGWANPHRLAGIGERTRTTIEGYYGRASGVWTRDLFVPNEARYQATPLPEQYLVLRTGIEPVIPPWEGGVLTAWPTEHGAQDGIRTHTA